MAKLRATPLQPKNFGIPNMTAKHSADAHSQNWTFGDDTRKESDMVIYMIDKA